MKRHPLHSFKYCPKCGSDEFYKHDERSRRCPSCGLLYYANVASAVAILVINKRGEGLFVRRAYEPAKGTLDMPGGFVEPFETAEQAAVRELEEETGLKASVHNCHYLLSLPNLYPFSGVDVYTNDLFFLLRVESFDGAMARDDAAELVVRPLSELKAEEFGLASIAQFVGLLPNLQESLETAR